MRRQATHWEKVFAKNTSDKRLLSKIDKELLKLNKKMKNPIKICAKDLYRYITKDTEMLNKYIKRCPTSYIIRVTNKTRRYNHLLIRMTKIQYTDTTKC